MKKLLFIAVMLGLSKQPISAQPCPSSRTYETIENRSMKVGILNGGDMFWDALNGSEAEFAVPYNYGSAAQTNAVFAGAVWLGAKYGGIVRTAAQTYRSHGHDYWSGPLEVSTGLPIADGCTNFDRIWKVKRWAIQRHIDDYNNNNVIDDPVDESLLSWPGKGNPHFATQMGFQLPNQDLAPFFDRNNDGIYNPMDGDYPVFEDGNSNAIAEEMLWSVFNDKARTHTVTNTLALNVEVQQTVYVFDCTNDDLLSQTLFVKHKVINRGSLSYTDFHYGTWVDFDLGCVSDDYTGTLAAKNTIYAYNSDNYDDVTCGSATSIGYGTNPPAQALTFLNHNLYKSIQYAKDPVFVPTSGGQYYNLLEGKFANGTPLTTGGNGYNPTNPVATSADYIYPDNPSNSAGWSMTTANLAPFDQLSVGSLYQANFGPGDVFEVDLAYSYHRDVTKNNYENVDLMEQQIDQIQQFYDNNFSTVTCAQMTPCTTNCVYPGDANNNGIANDFDILEMGLHYGASAATRSVIGNNWLPYAPPSPIANAHADADGNNVVDDLDLEANTINYGARHTLYTGAAEGSNTAGIDLTFKRYLNPWNPAVAILLDDIVHSGRYFVLDVNFGDAINTINDVHGLTFKVEYDNQAVELMETPSSISGLGYTALDEGWLGDDGADVYTRQTIANGKLSFVATRKNQINYTGGGGMGRLIFRIKSTAPVNAPTMSTSVCFNDFKAVRADGSTIAIGAQCSTIEYWDSTFVATPIQTVEAEETLIQVYPNPAQKHINVDLLGQSAKNIVLYNVLGEAVYEQKNINGIFQIARKDLPTGIYNLVVELDNGQTTTHKVVFQ